MGVHHIGDRAIFRRDWRNSPNASVICQLCKMPRDRTHDNARCAEAWLKKMDEEGNPSNTRRIKP